MLIKRCHLRHPPFIKTHVNSWDFNNSQSWLVNMALNSPLYSHIARIAYDAQKNYRYNPHKPKKTPWYLVKLEL